MNAISRLIKRTKHINAVASQLTSSVSEKKRVRNAGYELLCAQQLRRNGPAAFFDLTYENIKFGFHSEHVTDFSILWDIFIQQEYGLARRLKHVDTVIDFGSNIGVSAIFFHCLFPGAKITCFEPDRTNFRILISNIRTITNIQAFNVAAGEKDGRAPFFEMTERRSSSSVVRQSRNQRKVEVDMLRLDTIIGRLATTPKSLLKFDIDGAEYNLFRNSKRLEEISMYLGEVHEDLIGFNLFDFCELFRGYSIETQKIAPSRYIFLQRWEPRK